MTSGGSKDAVRGTIERGRRSLDERINSTLSFVSIGLTERRLLKAAGEFTVVEGEGAVGRSKDAAQPALAQGNPNAHVSAGFEFGVKRHRPGDNHVVDIRDLFDLFGSAGKQRRRLAVEIGPFGMERIDEEPGDPQAVCRGCAPADGLDW